MPVLDKTAVTASGDASQLYKSERYAHLPYFTQDEVSARNRPRCCWVSAFNLVRNLTPLIEEFKDRKEVIPLLKHAGQDISHWFDNRTGDIKHHIHPETGASVPFIPFGKIPHVETPLPSYAWKPLDKLPWWRDDKYLVGRLTQKQILLDIFNVLTQQHTHLNVCAEDTFERIQQRYARYNSNTRQYVWRYDARDLNMQGTCEENGVVDATSTCDELFMPHDVCVPCVFVYFKDEIF